MHLSLILQLKSNHSTRKHLVDHEDGNATSMNRVRKVQNLALDILLGTTYIDCCIERLFP